MDISLVVPIYNACAILKPFLECLVKTMEALPWQYEVLVGDDASTDGSQAVLAQMESRFPSVQSTINHNNRGLGFTLRQLVSKVSGKKVLYCDIDLPFGTKIIQHLVDEVEKHDIVIASRYRGVKNKVPFSRWCVSRLYYGFCQSLFHAGVVDIGSSTVAFRKTAWDQLSLSSDHFAIHIEMYWEAQRHGLSIKEIPARYIHNPSGSFRTWKHGPSTIWDTWKLYYQKRHESRLS